MTGTPSHLPSPGLGATASLALLLLAASATPSPGEAKSLELPVEIPLDAQTVALELWNAEVQMTFDGVAAAVLRAGVLGTGGRASLQVSFDGETLRIGREEDAESVPIRLDLTLDRSQGVRLVGSELALTAAIAAREEDEEEKELELELEPAPPGSVELVLERSRADLFGLPGVSLALTDSAVWLDGTSATVLLRLSGGSAEIRRHRGRLDLGSRDAEVALIDFRGQAKAEVSGGGLRLEGGSGNLEAGSDGASVVLERWRGGIALEAADGSVEARDCTAIQPWRLGGTGVQGSLEQVQGEVAATLTGGGLRVRRHQGKVTLVSQETTRFELEEIEGEAHLQLGGGAEAIATGVQRVLAATVVDGRIDGRDIGLLRLEASRSEIDLSAVGRIHQLRLTDSELSLDMTAAETNFALELLGSSRVELQLATPCEVRLLAGSGSGTGDGVDVSNCDLHLPGRPRESVRTRQLRYGNRAPRVVNVSLDEEATLRVEGLP